MRKGVLIQHEKVDDESSTFTDEFEIKRGAASAAAAKRPFKNPKTLFDPNDPDRLEHIENFANLVTADNQDAMKGIDKEQ